ncbi:hypothetical protein SE15_07670 [Thermanaerothrix daxensis]|uniref:Transglycosylase n=1 Tax=Thermanaerothrix daxensis TaxID=869279 RepID=A0A0P6Y1Z3_9CHLR|nr:hypothetical protein [Thermanaerothrix daxensis]KPL83136.1 hypothetical protein SE15_07670 [Thermanaerothrix daxensis]
MTIQSILLGICMATLLGALFHLWRGGGWVKLIAYLVAANLGFWVGHWAAGALNWTAGRVGPINLGGALVGGVLFLGLAYWLGQVEPPQGGKRA